MYITMTVGKHTEGDVLFNYHDCVTCLIIDRSNKY